MRKIILLGLGFAALAVGALGMLLPVLPTTPFVLCAASCFATSSPSVYKKLEKTRYFGEYIRNYRNKTGISQSARWTGIGFLWATLAVSAVLSRRPAVWAILAIVGVAVTIHILLLRAADEPKAAAMAMKTMQNQSNQQ